MILGHTVPRAGRQKERESLRAQEEYRIPHAPRRSSPLAKASIRRTFPKCKKQRANSCTNVINPVCFAAFPFCCEREHHRANRSAGVSQLGRFDQPSDVATGLGVWTFRYLFGGTFRVGLSLLCIQVGGPLLHTLPHRLRRFERLRLSIRVLTGISRRDGVNHTADRKS